MRLRIKTEIKNRQLTFSLFIFLILDSTHCFSNWVLQHFYTCAKWHKQLYERALQLYKNIWNKRSKQYQKKNQKNARFFIFSYKISLLLGHFYFQCILKNPWWYSKNKSKNFITKDLLKIINKSCYMQGYKILQIHAEKKRYEKRSL